MPNNCCNSTIDNMPGQNNVLTNTTLVRPTISDPVINGGALVCVAIGYDCEGAVVNSGSALATCADLQAAKNSFVPPVTRVPNVVTFTAGSGTYTPTPGTRYIEGYIKGGGGAGGAAATVVAATWGDAGQASSFMSLVPGGSVITAFGGYGGAKGRSDYHSPGGPAPGLCIAQGAIAIARHDAALCGWPALPYIGAADNSMFTAPLSQGPGLGGHGGLGIEQQYSGCGGAGSMGAGCSFIVTAVDFGYSYMVGAGGVAPVLTGLSNDGHSGNAGIITLVEYF